MSLYSGNAGSAELQLGITTFAALELAVPRIDTPKRKKISDCLELLFLIFYIEKQHINSTATPEAAQAP